MTDESRSNVRRRFYFSVDVDWVRGSESAIPGILDLCEELGCKGTFFTVGGFAEEFPESLAVVRDRGHEIGTHGYVHGVEDYENYRTAPYEDQLQWLTAATDQVEQAVGVRPVSFRAPNLWVSEKTLRALEALEYRFDSSVPAKRYDFGFGQLKHQTQYIRAPRDPYHPSPDHLAERGSSPVLEVPPSTFLFPMNMSGLRLVGLSATKWAVRRIMKRSDTLVFYIHPAEFVDRDKQDLGDDIPRRHLEGIGPQNFDLLRAFMEYVLGLGYESARIDEAEAVPA